MAHCCKIGYLSRSGGSAEAVDASEPLAMLVPFAEPHESLGVGAIVVAFVEAPANGASGFGGAATPPSSAI
eukprot:2445430-Prymnesium_polylepis.1